MPNRRKKNCVRWSISNSDMSGSDFFPCTSRSETNRYHFFNLQIKYNINTARGRLVSGPLLSLKSLRCLLAAKFDLHEKLFV